MTKKIAIFNHKGGVSKTTTAFNLGWMMARRNKKVLLVDSDSQCNLTLYSLGFQGYEDLYDNGNINNIKDALEPAFKAKPRLIDAIECKQVRRNDNLFLLPGHLDLTEYEVALGVSFQLSNALGTMKNLPGSFSYLIDKTAKKYNIDYVLIDMNPSLSAINQDLLVSSDYFMVPTSPDYFSYMAIKSLARVLPQWEKWAKTARPVFQDADYPLSLNTPKFIGYTINDFNLSQGKPSYSFEQVMNKISYSVIHEFIPSLAAENMVLDKSLYQKAALLNHDLIKQRAIDDYCIAEISNFNKLIAVSNKRSIPIFELNPDSDDMKFDNQVKTLNWFKRLFEIMSEKIFLLTE